MAETIPITPSGELISYRLDQLEKGQAKMVEVLGEVNKSLQRIATVEDHLSSQDKNIASIASAMQSTANEMKRATDNGTAATMEQDRRLIKLEASMGTIRWLVGIVGIAAA